MLTLDRRVLAAVDATPSRVPVLLGGCGCGRSAALLRIREQIGRGACQYVDVERIATTPERFLRDLVESSPFAATAASVSLADDATARDAFDAAVRFLDSARAPGGGRATFLLDEVLELRTFESFPGLRTVMRDLVQAIAQSGNRFVLASRYPTRAQRTLRDAPPLFEVVQVQPLSAAEVRHALGARAAAGDQDAEDLARAVQALGDGRPAYVQAIIDAMSAMRGADPLSALVSLMAPGGALSAALRFSYELRLHRARGYGALKAILGVLAEEEPLTLTTIAHRLRRTPGSTKDYLSWLEDVDLITVDHKRYSYADPLLRLWVRLHCAPMPPDEETLAREVHGYALARLPHAPEPALAYATGGGPDESKSWGIIEID